MPPKAPYQKKLGKRGHIHIWQVDGNLIRSTFDPEFTNFGQHFHFHYIPEYELWLDQKLVIDERRFFIDHLLTEWKLMKQGNPYETAIVAADIKEKTERYCSQKIKKLTEKIENFDINKLHLKLLGDIKTKLSVWSIDGCLVRTHFFIDFTEGGHHYIYDFIPENEVWIDNDLLSEEIPFVLLHELHERKLMKKLGWKYHRAHRHASQLEWLCRQGKKIVTVELKKLGWK